MQEVFVRHYIHIKPRHPRFNGPQPLPQTSFPSFSTNMNQSVDIANKLINDPPAELKDIMEHSSTSTEAKSALAEVGDARKPSQQTDSRLQVVNEKQEFTWVVLLHCKRGSH